MKTFSRIVLSITLITFFNATVFAANVNIGQLLNDPAVQEAMAKCRQMNPARGKSIDMGGYSCVRDWDGNLDLEILQVNINYERAFQASPGNNEFVVNINKTTTITAPPTVANVNVDGGWEWYDTLLLGLGSAALATLTGFFIAWCVTPENDFWHYR